jgi:hypothetical protein
VFFVVLTLGGLGAVPKGGNKAEIVFVKDGLAMDLRNVV